jgi:hypothetical protein
MAGDWGSSPQRQARNEAEMYVHSSRNRGTLNRLVPPELGARGQSHPFIQQRRELLCGRQKDEGRGQKATFCRSPFALRPASTPGADVLDGRIALTRDSVSAAIKQHLESYLERIKRVHTSKRVCLDFCVSSEIVNS